MQPDGDAFRADEQTDVHPDLLNDVIEDDEEVSEEAILAKLRKRSREKLGIDCNLLPFPLINPLFGEIANQCGKEGKILLYVSLFDLFYGYFAFVDNAVSAFCYVLVSTFYKDLHREMEYKWANFIMAMMWICFYPFLSVPKHFLLYHSVVSFKEKKRARLTYILTYLYLIISAISFLVFLYLFSGGPSAIGVEQFIEVSVSISTSWFFPVLLMFVCFFTSFVWLIEVFLNLLLLVMIGIRSFQLLRQWIRFRVRGEDDPRNQRDRYVPLSTKPTVENDDDDSPGELDS